MTKLLVSPRNLKEARSAYRGGAEIIDVKNPEEGSLGANFPWIISEIREELPSEIPISTAIGDFPYLPGSASLATLGALQVEADIVKVGLKGPDGENEVFDLVEKIARTIDENSETAQLVSCAYGDFERAGTIDPLTLPPIAAEAGADYVMIDTAVKDGRPLIDFLSMKELSDFVEEAHSLNLKAAFAGSLHRREIIELKSLNPDVIGIRGAACVEGDREKEISEKLVKEISELLGDGS